MKSVADKVRLRRVYDAPDPADGFRVLVDRLWPRGLTKQAACVDVWLKDVAPSTDLRRWYHADLARWPEFRRRYKAELARNPALDGLRTVVRQHTKRGGGGGGRVTLVYGAKDEVQNHAIVLRDALVTRMKRLR